MKNWKTLVGGLDAVTLQALTTAAADFGAYQVYPDSIHQVDGCYLFLAINDGEKVLIVYGEGGPFAKFSGEETAAGSGKAKICPLTIENVSALRSLFDWLNPVSAQGHPISMGLGDRLGLASAGHIRLLKNFNVFPILAQQSMRELNLTGRTYPDVLSDACIAVYQEGYKKGFGADGDHLKQFSEVQMALDYGYTMITLDCSEHIDNAVDSMTDSEVEAAYRAVPGEKHEYFENKYLGKHFQVEDLTITFSKNELMRIVLIYAAAISHAVRVYHELIATCARKIDFEVSIDETLFTTSPAAHFFTATELLDQGVEIGSLAPRFCGEFQKGIDYIGDINDFTSDFDAHAKIARVLGYKISVHSGSDKFSVFPIVGKLTNGIYHLKTAGTNWLEAVRVIAGKDPALYRRMHAFALSVLDEAKKYYHIGAKAENIPDIAAMGDDALPSLLDMVDSRQVLHITYGLILQARNPDGTYTFRDDIYRLLNANEDDYYAALGKHIGRHVTLLGMR